MTRPASATRTSDWQIEIAVGGSLGAVLHGDASLWRFYSPQLSYACASIAVGGGIGATIGGGVDADGSGILNQVASAAGTNVNQKLTIHQPFRSTDIAGATLSEISFGLGLGLQGTARDFDVNSRHGTPLFSFAGMDFGAFLGAQVSILNWTMLRFHTPFAVPVSRWDALAARQG